MSPKSFFSLLLLVLNLTSISLSLLSLTLCLSLSALSYCPWCVSTGAVPVVVGAPNIQDFAPSPGSVLHIKDLKDVDSVAKTMKYLAESPDAYNQSLRCKS